MCLGIEKLRIEKRQAWQNLIEAHFNIVRKMADAKFARATSWEEMIAIHRKWMRDYNVQRHWGHEKREDGCHSPVQVLAWHKGTMYPEVPRPYSVRHPLHALSGQKWVSALSELEALRGAGTGESSGHGVGV